MKLVGVGLGHPRPRGDVVVVVIAGVVVVIAGVVVVVVLVVVLVLCAWAVPAEHVKQLMKAA